MDKEKFNVGQLRQQEMLYIKKKKLIGLDEAIVTSDFSLHSC